MSAGMMCEVKVKVSKRLVFDITFTKRQGWNFNFNTLAEVGLHVFKDNNQYLFIQYFNGYGECMLDYNRYFTRLRIGMLLRPKFLSTF